MTRYNFELPSHEYSYAVHLGDADASCNTTCVKYTELDDGSLSAWKDFRLGNRVLLHTHAPFTPAMAHTSPMIPQLLGSSPTKNEPSGVQECYDGSTSYTTADLNGLGSTLGDSGDWTCTSGQLACPCTQVRSTRGNLAGGCIGWARRSCRSVRM